jgi:hypothetical protein
MWLKVVRPEGSVHMVKPEALNIEARDNTFAINNLQGDFVNTFVGKGYFEVDQYLN